MTRSSAKKRVVSTSDGRRSSKRIYGQKPAHVLNSSILRRICRMPPESKQVHTKAEVWYRNPQFRKVHGAAAGSVCNVCRQVHTPRQSSELALVKFQQGVQTMEVCSSSSIDDQSKQDYERKSGEENCLESSSIQSTSSCEW